jgi:hypothetical protein
VNILAQYTYAITLTIRTECSSVGCHVHLKTGFTRDQAVPDSVKKTACNELGNISKLFNSPVRVLELGKWKQVALLKFGVHMFNKCVQCDFYTASTSYSCIVDSMLLFKVKLNYSNAFILHNLKLLLSVCLFS